MFKWLSDKIDSVLQWFVDFFHAIVEYLKDVPLDVFDKVLSAIRGAFTSIPVPDFVVNGLQSFSSEFPPLMGYLLAQSGVAQGFALIGVAYTFRLLRKVFTLFQW